MWEHEGEGRWFLYNINRNFAACTSSDKSRKAWCQPITKKTRHVQSSAVTDCSFLHFQYLVSHGKDCYGGTGNLIQEDVCRAKQPARSGHGKPCPSDQIRSTQGPGKAKWHHFIWSTVVLARILLPAERILWGATFVLFCFRLFTGGLSNYGNIWKNNPTHFWKIVSSSAVLCLGKEIVQAFVACFQAPESAPSVPPPEVIWHPPEIIWQPDLQ